MSYLDLNSLIMVRFDNQGCWDHWACLESAT